METGIRAAELGDLEAILTFAAAVVPAHYTPILGADAARAQLAWWSRDRMATAVGAGRVHVAVSGGDVVGVCETGELAGAQVVWKLYLAPLHRGRALGVGLLHHAIASLPPGTESVDVEHVAGNTRAAAFYEREGFVVTRVEPAPVGAPSGSAVVWRRRVLR